MYAHLAFVLSTVDGKLELGWQMFPHQLSNVAALLYTIWVAATYVLSLAVNRCRAVQWCSLASGVGMSLH